MAMATSDSTHTRTTSTTSHSNTPSIPRSTHLHYLRQTISLAQRSPPKPSNFRVGCVIVSYPLSPTTSTSTSTPTTNTAPEHGDSQAEPAIQGTVISTGYTLELEGNTHAEQCALTKLHSSLSSSSETTTTLQPTYQILYTSLEPCSIRLSGNVPCVQRIITSSSSSSSSSTGPNDDDEKIDKVIFGAKEPGTFVTDSRTCAILDAAHLPWEYLPELEEEILSVAMLGHRRSGPGGVGGVGGAEADGATAATAEVTGEGEEEKKAEGGTRIDDISAEERMRQEALPRNPKKRMMDVPPGLE